MQTDFIIQFFTPYIQRETAGGETGNEVQRVSHPPRSFTKWSGNHDNNALLRQNKPKRGRKKKPNGQGRHLGLEVIGILGKTASPAFLSKTIQMALLCPSLETAKAVLAEQGVQINSKTLRRYCRLVGEKGMEWRGRMSLSGQKIWLA